MSGSLQMIVMRPDLTTMPAEAIPNCSCSTTETFFGRFQMITT
jgi:hypothetical protein